ncbi:MAG TPA: hypothetical protein VFR81_30575 [Longimicrobium sp.]|nr:hypothetical protein [Longimicrobium sp.]
MKRLFLAALAALSLVPAQHAAAQRTERHGIEIGSLSEDAPARMGPRRDAREARLAITTTNDVVSLMLTGDVVAMQLTERTLRQVSGEIERDAAEEDDGGFLGRMIGSVVRNSVSTMLRRSIEYPVSELRSVDYRGGRLVFTSEEGEEIFEDVEVNDTRMVESFSPADARAFVREFQAIKARTR